MNFQELEIADVKKCIPILENIKFLAKGGQKEVYKANLESKLVAVKFIHVGNLNEEQIELLNSNLDRVRREINLLDSIKSNYLPVLSEIKPGLCYKGNSIFYYYVEDYINGSNLVNKVLGNKEVIKMNLHIVYAIKNLWKFGVVHRDIKPGNIMYNNMNKSYVLVDLGFALMLSKPSLTDSGLVPGTHIYMSPEQLRGPKRKLDFRSDLFSLGVVVYEQITSTHPFVKSNMNESEITESILFAKEKGLDIYKDLFPEDFLNLIHKFLGKYPHMRYNSFDKIINILIKSIKDN